MGLLVGGVVVWLGMRGTVAVLKDQVHHSRVQEAQATDRLVHAWKEGATIPPRPTPAPQPIQPLPRELQEELAVWDDPEHRAILEAEMRTRMARGEGTTAILMALDDQHPR